ncbi:uncharacterized protein [Gorilla gorilla gorilla]|uniref:uncharacterized protein n=1 Tax=Gorilla gorilla gorilla TaxID=9595 RepID=UPI00300A226A
MVHLQANTESQHLRVGRNSSYDHIDFFFFLLVGIRFVKAPGGLDGACLYGGRIFPSSSTQTHMQVSSRNTLADTPQNNTFRVSSKKVNIVPILWIRKMRTRVIKGLFKSTQPVNVRAGT